MGDIDILSIDEKIQKKFNEERKKLGEYKERLEILKKNKSFLAERIRKNISCEINELEKKINNIENDEQLNFYISDSAELLEKYKKILTTPIRMSFSGKKIKPNSDKKKIIYEYLQIVKKYSKSDFIFQSNDSDVQVCDNCQNKKDFDLIEGGISVCLNCCAQKTIIKQTSSYRDVDRVNITAKYTYDRKVHFKDCINQYQGKQNSTVEEKVYLDLEDAFDRHHLLVGDKTTKKEIRFEKITCEHVFLFLKDLKYSKHYENVNLIHYNMTGKKPDDIGYLEHRLLDDFDRLTTLYDKKFRKNIARKNFINTQYVLFQLLTRHKHPCQKEDFSMLKNVDRTTFHDEICKELFEELRWNHTAVLG